MNAPEKQIDLLNLVNACSCIAGTSTTSYLDQEEDKRLCPPLKPKRLEAALKKNTFLTWDFSWNGGLHQGLGDYDDPVGINDSKYFFRIMYDVKAGEVSFYYDHPDAFAEYLLTRLMQSQSGWDGLGIALYDNLHDCYIHSRWYNSLPDWVYASHTAFEQIAFGMHRARLLPAHEACRGELANVLYLVLDAKDHERQINAEFERQIKKAFGKPFAELSQEEFSHCEDVGIDINNKVDGFSISHLKQFIKLQSAKIDVTEYNYRDDREFDEGMLIVAEILLDARQQVLNQKRRSVFTPNGQAPGDSLIPVTPQPDNTGLPF